MPPDSGGHRWTTSEIKKPAKPYAITGFWNSEDNFGWVFGAGCRTRTRHLMITNQLLYQMS